MCEVTPYMVSVATKRGISVIYHSAALLISTTGVVYVIYKPWLRGVLHLYTPRLRSQRKFTVDKRRGKHRSEPWFI